MWLFLNAPYVTVYNHGTSTSPGQALINTLDIPGGQRYDRRDFALLMTVMHKQTDLSRGRTRNKTRSSATAKSTVRPSCFYKLVYFMTFIGRQTSDQKLINYLYETGHETYRIPRNNAK